MLKGMETLDMRMERHCLQRAGCRPIPGKSFQDVCVLYPALPSHPQHALAMSQMSGGGGVVSFDVVGGRKEVFHLMNSLKLIEISPTTWVIPRASVTHPFTSTHQKLAETDKAAMGITEKHDPLSVGLEDKDDPIG